MLRIRCLAFAALSVLAACGTAPPPAPGEKPGWPQPDPPRPSYAPLPFTTNYSPVSGQVRQLPPVQPGENVPYAVPANAVPTAVPPPPPPPPPAVKPPPEPEPAPTTPAGPQAGDTPDPNAPPPPASDPRSPIVTGKVGGCHTIPEATINGRTAKKVCEQPDGSWAYIFD